MVDEYINSNTSNIETNTDITKENIKNKDTKFSISKFKFLTPNFYLWLKQQCPLLSEEDFYPPEDNRLYHSGVRDIENGDTFDDYATDYYNVLSDDGFYD